MADGSSRLHIEDLGGAIAARRNEATVGTESHATDDTLVGQVVDEVDIEDTACTRVEDGIPVLPVLLQVVRHRFMLKVSQDVA